MRNVITLSVGLLFLPYNSATAQPAVCRDRDVSIQHLLSEFDEHRVAVALTARGAGFELFANLETGTWTVLITNPAGLACLAAEGSNFGLTLADPKAPKGDL